MWRYCCAVNKTANTGCIRLDAVETRIVETSAMHTCRVVMFVDGTRLPICGRPQNGRLYSCTCAAIISDSADFPDTPLPERIKGPEDVDCSSTSSSHCCSTRLVVLVSIWHALVCSKLLLMRPYSYELGIEAKRATSQPLALKLTAAESQRQWGIREYGLLSSRRSPISPEHTSSYKWAVSSTPVFFCCSGKKSTVLK